MQITTAPCVVCGCIIKFLFIDEKLVHIGHAGCATPTASLIVDNPRLLGRVTSD